MSTDQLKITFWKNGEIVEIYQEEGETYLEMLSKVDEGLRYFIQPQLEEDMVDDE